MKMDCYFLLNIKHGASQLCIRRISAFMFEKTVGTSCDLV